uniref:UrcA family protein n=1 Tax=Altererythrobacter segetis TaxID=1104773 RepID=UPI001409419D|nr:UrcA family protein [Altererythrobacter segetis]
MNTHSAILAATLSAALLSATTAPAAAAPSGQASVSYSDLDLSTDAGRAELAARYDQAARQICGGSDASQKLHGKERYCYESTSKQLKARVASILSDHDAKTGVAVAAR